MADEPDFSSIVNAAAAKREEELRRRSEEEERQQQVVAEQQRAAAAWFQSTVHPLIERAGVALAAHRARIVTKEERYEPEGADWPVLKFWIEGRAQDHGRARATPGKSDTYKIEAVGAVVMISSSNPRTGHMPETDIGSEAAKAAVVKALQQAIEEYFEQGL